MDVYPDFDPLPDPGVRPSVQAPAPSRVIDRLEQAALDFDDANPHIRREIVEVSLRMWRAGHRHWSINAAFEVVRYNAATTSTGTTYKLNNNHRAFYARWIMRDHPELAGFFSVRDVGRVPQEYDE